MLPPDWRERMAAVIRGAADAEPGWLRATPTLDPDRQIAIYREQHRLRLGDALREEARGLTWLLGDDPALLYAYLDACPPASWTLNHVAWRLPAWLEARGAPDEQVDMAALDVAVSQAFEAADGVALTPETISGVRRAPHVRLLRLRSNVHERRSAALESRPPPPPEVRPIHLVVFRRGLGVRHAEVEPGAWAALAALDDGLEAALAAIAPEDAPRVAAWFQTFAEAGWAVAG